MNEEEPFELAHGIGSDTSEASGESESETDFSEDERERKLLALQEQLRQVQEQMKVCSIALQPDTYNCNEHLYS